MTAHGQADEKVDAIAKFGKMRLETLDQNTFSDILKKVRTNYSVGSCYIFSPINDVSGIKLYESAIAWTAEA